MPLLPTTPALLEWMWQSTCCLGACWLLYQLALRKEPCFHFNRWFLVLVPWLALGLPLLPLPSLELGSWLPAAPIVTPTISVVALSPAATVPSVAQQVLPDVSAAPWQWLAVVYVAGVLVWLVRLGWQLAALRMALRQLPHEPEFAYTLVLTGGKLPISSFGEFVFWDETAPLTTTEAQYVLQHELAHVQQGHTWEQLQLEVLRAVLWFNPFVHLLPRALRLTHEYLADAAVLATTTAATAPTTYTALLARLTLRQFHPRFSLTHSFAQSHTLARIAMLHTTSVRRWKQWLLLPLGAGLLVMVACTQKPELVVPINNDQTTSNKVYTYQQVEQVPIYETGTHKLFGDIVDPIMHSRRYYSRSVIAAHPKGRIVIRFEVAENGNMQNVAIDQSSSDLKGPAAAIEEAQARTLSAVRNLPGHWTPGRQAGKAVPVLVTLICDVNPSSMDIISSKYPDLYHFDTLWSFDGVDAKASMGISIPIREPSAQNLNKVNKYAIRPDSSYYKNHKRQ
ncbi:M56 family metallopeptidase [Hymenobacter sp. GOD-10R]|uniref:M56 family metallopeptidase n=1 Tax=Hymenobacter sp. GOD-10R TaxID=3093922 RepID=UPI002D79D9CD|nr:M56 family metallopeptidase [Hymenobacter sp. GOD-10R]WRQ28195.1 M56 family metallopeptidase [Hymenobacter sp. GOD-10R]